METLLGSYLREEGLGQTEFARMHGFLSPMVCMWASGKRRPGIENAIAIEKATDGRVPVAYWTTVKTPKDVTAARSARRRRKAG